MTAGGAVGVSWGHLPRPERSGRGFALGREVPAVSRKNAVAEPAAIRPPLTAALPRLWRATRERMLPSFAHPNFARLWRANAGAMTAHFVQFLAQGWLVVELTNSAFALGLLAFFQSLPMLLLSQLGGLLADRLSRPRLLMFAQSVNGLAALTIGILVATGAIAVWHLAISAMVSGAMFAISVPARYALISESVPRGPGAQRRGPELDHDESGTGDRARARRPDRRRSRHRGGVFRDGRWLYLESAQRAAHRRRRAAAAGPGIDAEHPARRIRLRPRSRAHTLADGAHAGARIVQLPPHHAAAGLRQAGLAGRSARPGLGDQRARRGRGARLPRLGGGRRKLAVPAGWRLPPSSSTAGCS